MGVCCDVLWLQTVHLFDNDVELHKKLTVFLVRTASVVCPARGDGVFVERAEDGLLDMIRDGHVILNRIQPPQYEVK